MVAVDVRVGVSVIVGVNVKVGDGVRVEVGVSVHAVVAVMDEAVKAACASGEGPHALSMKSTIHKAIILFII
jgi:hypothetical protein